MPIRRPILLAGGAALALAGCTAVPPTGPSFAALPGQGKSLQAFQSDDYNCRAYAAQVMSGAPAAADASTRNGVATAAGGALLGTAAGALLGAAAGNAGIGAAAGAGAGLLAGTAIGANQVSASSAGLQAQYDGAYAQCMVAAGDHIPQPPTTVAVPYPVYPPPAYYAPPPVVVAPGYGYGWRYRGW